MQAFVCMMQRDWPQVHQEGKRREELFKQSVNRPIAIDNLILFCQTSIKSLTN